MRWLRGSFLWGLVVLLPTPSLPFLFKTLPPQPPLAVRAFSAQCHGVPSSSWQRRRSAPTLFSSPARSPEDGRRSGNRKGGNGKGGKQGDKMRLQKLLSHAGVCSRREAERYIEDGRVTVNERLVTELGTKVDPQKDRVTVDGELVSQRPVEEIRWVAMYKPKGVVCTMEDEKDRKTVMDALPGASRARLLPVGRLDRNSAGLLLLTNDNSWLHKLTHPSHGCTKMYRIVVEGFLSNDVLRRIAQGLQLPDEERKLSPCAVEFVDQDLRQRTTSLRIVLQEGRNRQIRRMMDFVGFPVKSLTRTSVGSVGLRDLSPGDWRELSKKEVDALKRTCTPRHRGDRRATTPRDRRDPAAGRQKGGSDREHRERTADHTQDLEKVFVGGELDSSDLAPGVVTARKPISRPLMTDDDFFEVSEDGEEEDGDGRLG
uniref:RNA-binding S4 domain-containing protein n=1 Tax=Rhizochromulina marina TaxID=1034831 RepID=A0A7S2WX07_9STRA|mmetsp:Transcript_9094/g.26005  ORF Transcript_9094/g.26005 Transcript_9094/m.26005 type:complete len:429 (+) Transcript_9094:73-1359(+)